MTRFLSLLAGAVLCVILLSIGVSQEPPIGGLTGKLTMNENGRPLADQMVSIEPLIENDEYWTPSYDTTDENGVYQFTRLAAGAYRVSASTKAHTVKTQIVSVEEGKVTTHDLSAEPSERYLRIYASKRVFTPDVKPTAELHGFIDGDSVRTTVYRLAPEEVVRSGGLSSALGGFVNSQIEKPLDRSLMAPVADFPHRIAKRDVEGTFVEDLQLPEMPEGIYLVQCRGGGLKANVVLSVSRIALVTKSGGKQALCFVADLESGQPVVGATILRKDGERVVEAGKTDKDGLFQTPVGGNGQTVFLAKSGSSSALCDFYLGEDEESESNGETRIFTYTERPVYRPGDTVNFKGIVRRLAGSEYRLPGRGSATVQLVDANENLVSKTVVPISSHGTFHGSFTSSTEADPGPYQLKVRAMGGSDDHYFPFAAYRKPEIAVTVKSDQSYVIFGGTASATVECKYYFGGPVVGAKVEANIYRSPHYDFVGDDEDYEEYGDEGGPGGEYSERIEAVTDENGKATIRFKTKVEGDADTLDTDYDYNLYVQVAESGDKYVSAEGTVPVVQAAFKLSLDSDVYAASVGDRVPMTLTTRTHTGQPSGAETVTVVVGREQWQNGVSSFIPLQTIQRVTGEKDGKAIFDVPITSPKSLTIRASAKDVDGHETTAEQYLYVFGDEDMRNEQAGQLTLTLDRKTYAEGRNARLVIGSDSPGGVALVTVEADRILAKRVVPLSSKATTVDIPIEPSFVPNAYVGVAYVHKGKFAEATKRLVVDLGERKLQVSVTSDRKVVKPGESVNLTVKTTDPAGKPERAEVSLAVVDESIYAIREDSTDPLKGLYPKRYNAISTNYSFQEIYLDGGDKSPANIPVRRKFLDTAFWRPSVMTGRDGTARLHVNLPDNLTAWRATALGVTDGTAVGIGTGKVVARKDLMVRLSLPTFMVQGDTQRIVANVNNDSGRDADVHVSLDVKGASVEGDAARRVRVANGHPQGVEWTLRTPRSGQATFTAKAWIDNGPNDGVEQSIPVSPHGRLTRQTDSGPARGAHTVDLNRLPTADPNVGGLTVVVSPGLLGMTEDALEGLVGFPYGCVEQTMSRFLPSILVEKLVANRTVASQVPKIAADGFARLQNMQHSDGGWGWWVNDDSDPAMTAYVLDGLDLARQAGYSSDRVDTKRAVEWAVKRLAKPDKEDTQRDLIYLAYAIGRFGERQKALGFLSSQRLDKADASAIAYAAMLVGPGGNAEYLRRLESMAKPGPTGSVMWLNGNWQWGCEGTSVPLRALAEFEPESPIVPRAIHYLMTNRYGSLWYSTRDTSSALIALTKYLGAKPEPAKETTVTVALNGRTLRSFSVAPGDTNPIRIDVAPSGLGKGSNRLEIRTTDDVPVYYSMELRQYDVQPRLAAQDNRNGIGIRRTYRLMAPTRNRYGQMQLLPSGGNVDSVSSGTAIQCELVVTCKEAVPFALVEDPIPSNCRVTERENLDEGESWGWWYSNLTIRDDRVAFFADTLRPGKNTFTYMLQAESPGVSNVLPALVQNMYDPSTSAWSAESRLEVR